MRGKEGQVSFCMSVVHMNSGRGALESIGNITKPSRKPVILS